MKLLFVIVGTHFSWNSSFGRLPDSHYNSAGSRVFKQVSGSNHHHRSSHRRPGFYRNYDYRRCRQNGCHQ